MKSSDDIRALNHWDAFPRTAQEIVRGKEQGLHHGLQLTVFHHGQCRLNAALGDRVPGEPLTADTLLLWRSAGKPLTTLLIAQCVEAGWVSWDTNLGRDLRFLQSTAWAGYTLRQVMTHQAGLHEVDVAWSHAMESGTNPETVFQSIAPPTGWDPRNDAAYSAQAAWWLVSCWIERLTGQPFVERMRRSLLEPLGLHDTWVGGMPESIYINYGSRIGRIYAGFPPPIRMHPTWNTALACAEVRPGGNTWSAASGLARLYEALRIGDVPGIGPVVLSGLRSRQRWGLVDQTFRAPIEMGLGFILQPLDGDPETIAYTYGRHASRETFGHGGSQCASAWCDPVHGLSVAWVANGMPGEVRHQKRAKALNAAIYEDLGLVSRSEFQ